MRSRAAAASFPAKQESSLTRGRLYPDDFGYESHVYETRRQSKLWHGPATFLAVWLAMAVAGMTPFLVSSPVVSLLIYAALLAAYARWTEAGRRSTLAYFLAGLFPPLDCFVLLTPLLPHLEPSFFQNGGALVFVGISVGFQTHGGADTPIEAYLPLMWMNLLLPIVAVIGVRGFLRYRRG